MASTPPQTTSDWVRFKNENSDLFSSTFADKERKNIQQQQTANLAGLNIPQETPEEKVVPVAKAAMPAVIENYSSENAGYKSWSDFKDAEINNKAILNESPIGRRIKSSSLEQQNINQEQESSFKNYSEGEYSLNDLDEDETYQQTSIRFLKSIGSDENIYENLRDAKYSIGDAVALAYRSGKWDQQTKDDYKYLKTVFDNANTEGVKHILQATKDIAIDVVFDLPNLLAVPFIISTGGVAGAGLATASKLGLTQSFRQGAKKLSQRFAENKGLRNVSIGMTEGAYDAGVISLSNQVSDSQTGIRQGISGTEAVGMTAFGAVAGGSLAAGTVKLANTMNRRNLNKYVEESGLPRSELEDATPEQIKKWRKGVTVYNKIVGSVTGKATTPYQELARSSGTLKELLENIRYDAMRTFADKGPVEVAKAAYGGSVAGRQGKYVLWMQKAMAQLQGKRGKIKEQDNSDLLWLLSKEIDLDDYVKLIEVKKTEGRDVYEHTQKVFKEGREIPENVVAAAKGMRDAFNKMFDDGLEIKAQGGVLQGSGTVKLFKKGQELLSSYFPRHWNLEAIITKRKELEELLVDSKHSVIRNEDSTRVQLIEEGLEDGIDVPKDKIKLIGQNDKPIDIKTIDQHVFGDVIDPVTGKPFLERYEGFEDMALETIVNKYKLKNIKTIKELFEFDSTITNEFNLTARKFKAKVIVQQMINRGDPQYNQISKGLGGNTFTRERAFSDLNDLDLQRLGFISTDVQKVVTDYSLKMGQTIERAKFFGRSEDEFNDRFLNPIVRELKESAPDGAKLNEKELREGLNKLYKVTTGLEYSVPKSKIVKGLSDVIKVTQQLAHLPFATLSSLSEPLIALSRADIVDTNAFVTEFGKAGGRQVKKSFTKLFDTMKGLTGKDVRLFKELDDETFMEVYQAGVATENAMMDKIEGMYGEGLQSGTAKKISNWFFNANLLQPWTQAVQMGAFKFGQQKVIRIIGELNSNKNFYGVSLDPKMIQRRRNQLHEIGIDSNEAMSAYRRHIDSEGLFNEAAFRQDKFFDAQVSPATALFSREIILNPSAAEGNKPLWFNNWWAQLLVQFAGYPTAFNNTVLKGMARSVISDPAANVPKVLAATTMMTGVAVMTNAIRSEGRSINEAENDLEIVADGVRRWGGYGPFDYIHRYVQGSKMNSGGITSLLKAPTGPIVSDFLDMILYRQGIPEVAVQNLPGYSAYPRDTRKALRSWSKNLFPEQKYDQKMFYAEGGKVNTAPIKDETYIFLTRDENEYETDDNSPISLYKENDLPDLDIKDTFYIDLKGFTVADKLNAYRQSATIGVPVYRGKGKGNVAGKIKFHKVLELDIENATIETVQQSINKNKDKIIYTDEVIAKEIIKETDYQLTLRDDVLRDDPDKTQDKINMLQKSKSFLVRNEILKLGYDAIKTKEGYTLLRENQFLPTDIIKRNFSKGGLASALNKRQPLATGDVPLAFKEARDYSPKYRTIIKRDKEPLTFNLKNNFSKLKNKDTTVKNLDMDVKKIKNAEGKDMLLNNDRAYLYSYVYNLAKKENLPFPEIVASQAALESGHGTSYLARETNNILGVKKWKGSNQKTKNMPTKEIYGKDEVIENADFVIYNSIKDSIKGYAAFLNSTLERQQAYKAKSPEEYIKLLKKQNYATDPDYVKKVLKIRDTYESFRRNLFNQGGYVDYDVWKAGAKLLGIDEKNTKQIKKDADQYYKDYILNNTTNNMADPDKAFLQNSIKHGLLSYRHGSNRFKRAALQAKEVWQRDPDDRYDNARGFTLRKKYPDVKNQESKAIEDLINSTLKDIKNNITPYKKSKRSLASTLNKRQQND